MAIAVSTVGRQRERASSSKAAPDPRVADCLEHYLRTIATFPLLTEAQERRLARLAARGNRTARQELISANLRLVVKIAGRYATYGVPLCDLIQEGNLGLIRAVERFDWRRGTRFGTYATYWIRESITRALTHGGRTVRLTGYAYRRFRQHGGGTRMRGLVSGCEAGPSAAVPVAEPTARGLTRILSAAAFPVSLDEPVDGERKRPPLEEVACDCGCDPVERTEAKLSFDDLRRAINSLLDPRERHIILRGFGLDGAASRSLTHMAQDLRISPERVRQLRARALAKLRAHLTGAL